MDKSSITIVVVIIMLMLGAHFMGLPVFIESGDNDYMYMY